MNSPLELTLTIDNLWSIEQGDELILANYSNCTLTLKCWTKLRESVTIELIINGERSHSPIFWMNSHSSLYFKFAPTYFTDRYEFYFKYVDRFYPIREKNYEIFILDNGATYYKPKEIVIPEKSSLLKKLFRRKNEYLIR